MLKLGQIAQPVEKPPEGGYTLTRRRSKELGQITDSFAARHAERTQQLVTSTLALERVQLAVLGHLEPYDLLQLQQTSRFWWKNVAREWLRRAQHIAQLQHTTHATVNTVPLEAACSLFHAAQFNLSFLASAPLLASVIKGELYMAELNVHVTCIARDLDSLLSQLEYAQHSASQVRALLSRAYQAQFDAFISLFQPTAQLYTSPNFNAHKEPRILAVDSHLHGIIVLARK
jgi:hypothetical protein